MCRDATPDPYARFKNYANSHKAILGICAFLAEIGEQAWEDLYCQCYEAAHECYGADEPFPEWLVEANKKLEDRLHWDSMEGRRRFLF